MNPVEDFARFVEFAHPDIRFGNGLENLHLLQVVRALVDVRNVRRALKGLSRLVGLPITELCCAQSLQGIDQGRVKPVLNDLDDLDGGREVLDRGVVLAGAVLDDGEVVQGAGRFPGQRSVDPDRQFNDPLGCDIGLIQYAFLDHLPVARKFLAQAFFVCFAAGFGLLG